MDDLWRIATAATLVLGGCLVGMVGGYVLARRDFRVRIESLHAHLARRADEITELELTNARLRRERDELRTDRDEISKAWKPFLGLMGRQG